MTRRLEKNAGSAAGTAPGENSGQAPSLPEFRGGRRDQVKGTIGEGERTATYFRGKAAPGTIELSQDEVMSRYRRQAEAELATERIPVELKDTIRDYFLSLDRSK